MRRGRRQASGRVCCAVPWGVPLCLCRPSLCPRPLVSLLCIPDVWHPAGAGGRRTHAGVVVSSAAGVALLGQRRPPPLLRVQMPPLLAAAPAHARPCIAGTCAALAALALPRPLNAPVTSPPARSTGACTATPRCASPFPWSTTRAARCACAPRCVPAPLWPAACPCWPCWPSGSAPLPPARCWGRRGRRWCTTLPWRCEGRDVVGGEAGAKMRRRGRPRRTGGLRCDGPRASSFAPTQPAVLLPSFLHSLINSAQRRSTQHTPPPPLPARAPSLPAGLLPGGGHHQRAARPGALAAARRPPQSGAAGLLLQQPPGGLLWAQQQQPGAAPQ